MDKNQRDKFLHHYWQVQASYKQKHDNNDITTTGHNDNDDDIAHDNAQEIMMLLIGESSLSHAHLVNGAVVNVRARVRLIFIFSYDWIYFLVFFAFIEKSMSTFEEV